MLVVVGRYTYVQLTALYPAYIHAARPGARAQFGHALDMIWADTAANTFGPRGALSGPHSRDYDTLLGHGLLYFEMYVWGLEGAGPLHCEHNDPHCEGQNTLALLEQPVSGTFGIQLLGPAMSNLPSPPHSTPTQTTWRNISTVWC